MFDPRRCAGLAASLSATLQRGHRHGARVLPGALALLILALPSASHAASAPPDPRLRPLLATQACGADAVARDADVGVDGGGVAQVLCPSIERVANHAIRLRSECRRRDARWQCEPLGKEFSLEVNGRRASVLYPVALDSWAAYQMARAIAPLAIAVAQGPRTRRDEQCRLSGDYGDLKVARMALRCSDWTVDFVRLCDPSGCRHEPASRFSNARPKHRARD